MRILVVDDEPSLRSALERALRLHGYDVSLAGDGEHGLACVAADSPDAVVLDVLMPGLDGIAACRRLRAAGDRTPVLMLTARDSVADRSRTRSDGALDPSEAVFLAGPRRVGALKTPVGAPAQPGGELLETSSTEPVVTVDLDARRQAIVAAGDALRVELPSGRTVPGTIRSVGTVAEVSSADPATGGSGETNPTVEVTIGLRDTRTGGGLDGAPVTVEVESGRTRNALAVPVEALLPLRGGGFALEVVESDTRRLEAAETGTFADGWVEVRGRGIGSRITPQSSRAESSSGLRSRARLSAGRPSSSRTSRPATSTRHRGWPSSSCSAS